MYFYSKIAWNPKFLSHCPIMNWVTSDQHSPMKRCQFSTRIPRPCRPDTQFYIHDIVQVSGYHKPLQLHWREPNHSCWVLMPKDCIEPMYGTLKDSNVRLVLLSSQEFGYFLRSLAKGNCFSDLALSGNFVSTIHCLIIILIYLIHVPKCSIFSHVILWGIPRVYPMLVSTPFSHSSGGIPWPQPCSSEAVFSSLKALRSGCTPRPVLRWARMKNWHQQEHN